MAPIDPAGIAFAAIQELAKQNAVKDEELAALRNQISQLRRTLQTSLAQNQHSHNKNLTQEELR